MHGDITFKPYRRNFKCHRITEQWLTHPPITEQQGWCKEHTINLNETYCSMEDLRFALISPFFPTVNPLYDEPSIKEECQLTYE